VTGDASGPTEPDPGSKPSSSPKTRRGQASRDRLVDAAVASVVEHGVTQMRLEEVLAASGSSKSQLYHYFSDRDGLIDAAVARRCEEFLGLLRQALGAVSSLDGLSMVLDGFAADYAMQLDGCPIGSLAGELVSGPDAARRTTVEAFATWEDLLTSALQRIQDSGELGSGHDVRELAMVLLVNFEGGMFLSQLRGSDLPLRAALTAALAHLESLGRKLD
jgi:TetR/AcrR family transcriptional regulator, transcriptional repressor for nem operon